MSDQHPDMEDRTLSEANESGSERVSEVAEHATSEAENTIGSQASQAAAGAATASALAADPAGTASSTATDATSSMATNAATSALGEVGVPAGAAAQQAASAATSIGGSAISSALRQQGAGDSAAASEAAVTAAGSSAEMAAEQAIDGASGPMSSAVSSALGIGDENEHVTLHFECEDYNRDWVVEAASYDESLNTPYTLNLNLATEDGDAEPAHLLGSSCQLSMERGNIIRPIKGIVTQVHEGNADEHGIRTRISVVPAFSLMQQRTNTRIFQEMDVPKILATVLEEGLGAYNRTFEQRLSRTYPVCEYRTQYDESDFSFCQRLMEEEGIIYWFEHHDDTELLVLADSPEQYGEVQGLHGSAIAFTEYENDSRGHEAITSFNVMSQLRPTKVLSRHYDWTHPTEKVEGDSSENEPDEDATDYPHGGRLTPERESYEHDHEPLTFHEWSDAWTNNDVDDQVRLRREQQIYDVRVASGESTVIGITAGQVFEMTGHPRPEFNGRYLVLSVNHSFSGNAVNGFHCIPEDTVYRPRRIIPKPRISSVQTATVVGPSGEEIHTDLHGRIKVQFHWDREGQLDDKSSCYVRVMQPWAGAQWGFVFIPRIGMEVVVTFVNGDPDQPLVVGSVYNADNGTPYPLPDEKTKSSIKTNSSLGGDGYNELTFEDAAGEEQIIVHAQKDYNETVENNHSTTVHANQTNSVDGNQSESVGGNQSMSVGKNRTVTIEGSENITINGAEGSGGVTGASRNITGDYKIDASGWIESQAPDHIKLTCGGSSILIEPGKITITAGDGSSLTLDANAVMESSQGSALTMDADVDLLASTGADLFLNANADLTSTGVSQLLLDGDATMTSSGGSSVTLTGDANMASSGGSSVALDGNATVSGSGEATVTAPKSTLAGGGGSVEAAGAGVTASGSKVDISGQGAVNIAGAIVKIN